MELLEKQFIRLNLFRSKVSGWQQIEYGYLSFCLKRRVTHMGQVRHLLRSRLKAIGRENYEFLQVNNVLCQQQAVNVPSPVALGYAIEVEELLTFEIQQIKFPLGATADTFMKKERGRLVDTIITQITQRMLKTP